MGYPPLRIDILTSIDGVSFEEAYQHKQIIEIEDWKANYIGLNDFIRNKQASGRLQDLADVKVLESKQRKP